MVVSDAPRYPHLLPAVQLLADAPNAVRTRRIWTDRWLGYARAEAALMKLEELRLFPKRNRMPNLLIVGPSNNGKTMIVEKFRRDHPAGDFKTARNTIRVPVVKVQMPPAPDERRFFAAISAAIGASDRGTEPVAVVQSVAVALLRATQAEMLIVDEVHNLLSGTSNQQRRFLNVLRWLGNELQIPLVAVGTADALRAIQSDDQLASRFMPFALSPWRAGAEFSRLVGTLEAVMPLKEPSNLSEPRVAQKLLACSEGILGEVVALVSRAAIAAIEAGEERIRLETLEAVGFVPPSRRRRVDFH